MARFWKVYTTGLGSKGISSAGPETHDECGIESCSSFLDWKRTHVGLAQTCGIVQWLARKRHRIPHMYDERAQYAVSTIPSRSFDGRGNYSSCDRHTFCHA